MKYLYIFFVLILILQKSALAETEDTIFKNENKLLQYLKETNSENLSSENLNSSLINNTLKIQKTKRIEAYGVNKKLPSPENLNSQFSLITKNYEAKVGLLLPTSGKYSNLSKSITNAIDLAVFSIKDSNLKILPFDTKGTLFGAYEAVQQAVQSNVDIIIGPLFSETTKVVASVAQKHNINVLSFSNDEKLVNKGAFIFGYNPRQQVIRALEFSIANGIADFIILTPNNKYGAASARNLRIGLQEYESTSLLKSEIYQELYASTLDKLNYHVYSAYNAALKSRPSRDYDYDVDMWNDNKINYPRGMFIMSDIDNILSVIKLLKKYKINNKEVQIIGNSAWYNDKILDYPEVVEGAWLVTYDIKSKKAKAFEKSYLETFNTKPNDTSILAYDLISLVSNLAKSSDGNDFTIAAIIKERGFAGINGIFRFHRNGLVERSLYIVQIKKGKFVLIDPPIENFFKVKQIPVLYNNNTKNKPNLGLDGFESNLSDDPLQKSNDEELFIKNIEESIFN